MTSPPSDVDPGVVVVYVVLTPLVFKHLGNSVREPFRRAFKLRSIRTRSSGLGDGFLSRSCRRRRGGGRSLHLLDDLNR